MRLPVPWHPISTLRDGSFLSFTSQTLFRSADAQHWTPVKALTR
ncbi:hypothetical protein [Dactylosporangium roseum]|nr:hypothetical protein [Dactylosporangium roseum]